MARKRCLGAFVGMVLLLIVLIFGILVVFKLQEKSLTGSFASVPDTGLFYIPVLFVISIMIILTIYICKRKI